MKLDKRYVEKLVYLEVVIKKERFYIIVTYFENENKYEFDNIKIEDVYGDELDESSELYIDIIKFLDKKGIQLNEN